MMDPTKRYVAELFLSERVVMQNQQYEVQGHPVVKYVEATRVSDNTVVVRVLGRDNKTPRYFTVKVSEQL